MWPFVARDDEIAQIGESQRGIVLVGEAGIGKTRLLVEAVKGLANEGRVVHAAATASLSEVPFGALAGALAREIEPGPSVEALSRVLQALVGDGDLSDLVLAVDDAHLLDDASAGLVLVAAQGGARVLATVRTGEVCPDAVLRLWKDDYAPRLDLRPLDEIGLGDLLRVALGAPVDDRSRHRLFATTAGNLLFLRELVRHAQDTGALSVRSGVWTWVEPDRVAPGVLDLVADRLRSVPAGATAVVESLAVAEPLGREVAEVACGTDACREAERLGVVVSVVSGDRDELRLVHPLYGQVVREGLSASRRRRRAAAVVDALVASGERRRDDRLRIALLSMEAGRPCDPVALGRAAQEAGARGDLALAERFAREAVRTGGGFESKVILAQIVYWAGAHSEVVELLGTEPNADVPGAVATNAALIVSQYLYWGLGDLDAALDLLDRTISVVGPDHECDVLGLKSETLMFAGRPRESIEAGLRVLSDDRASVTARLRAYSGVLVSQAKCGRFAEVEAALPGAMASIAEAGPDLAVYTTGGAVVASFLVNLFTGRLDESDALFGALYADALDRPADPYLGVWSFLLGRSALAQGRLAEAGVRLHDAAAVLRNRDPGEMLPWTLAALAQVHGATDDGARASEAVDEMLAVRTPAIRHIDVDVELGRAWAACAQGERTRARDLALSVGHQLIDDGRVALAGLALHDALRLGVSAAELVEVLDQIAVQAEGKVLACFAEHARALAAGDVDSLLGAADHFEEAGWLLHAAECAAGASALAAEAGLRVRQADAAARAATLAKVCGAALTPMLSNIIAKAGLDKLTRREQEIALLACRGLSKREMAEMLSLSVRTVGNHINHVYAKLGIGTRAELALALAGPSGDGPAT
jgi:DNA-binding CsgD family transcriptional regulator